MATDDIANSDSLKLALKVDKDLKLNLIKT